MKNSLEGSRTTERENQIALKIVARLSHYLNDYSEDIPTERVIGSKKHKVNDNWFQGVLSNMQYVVAYFMLKDTALGEEIDAFSKKIRGRRKEGAEAMERGEQPDNFVPTTREEIDQANALLKKVIKNLQNRI